MTATVPTRMLALIGLAAAALAAFFLVVRPLLLDESESTSAATNSPTNVKPAAQPSSPATPAVKPDATPAVQLLPGLPASLARALRREKVVVVGVWAPSAGDTQALAQARAGAKATGAGFVALNVLFEGHAKALQRLAGPISDPSVLVVKRPGRVANRLEGFADSATVAQAAHNAGAR